MRLLSIAWIFVAACEPELSAGRCDDGTLCENATWCVEGGGCEPPNECTGVSDGIFCHYGADVGRCIAGQCEPIPTACDGVAIDPGEACDGNALACAELDEFQFGIAQCNNCIPDLETCHRVGWTRRDALATTAIPRSIWADGGVVWFGTTDGLYRLERGTLALVEAGVWPYVTGIRGGEALAINTTGELVYLEPGGTVTMRTRVTETAPRSLAVVAGDIFVGAAGEIRRASTGFALELLPDGGDAYALHAVGGTLYAAGSKSGAGRVWRRGGNSWTAIVLADVPPITSLSSTNATLELGTQSGWFDLVNDAAVFDETRPGTKATPWADGRLLFDNVDAAPMAYVDPAGRIASIDAPSSSVVATAGWDATTRTMWSVDRAGVISSHSGIDLAKLEVAGVSGMQRLGMDLAVGFDAMPGTNPMLTILSGDGLIVRPPTPTPLIAIGTAGSGTPFLAHTSIDAHRHFISRGTPAASSNIYYDTSTGAAYPKTAGGPPGIRAYAERAGEVIGVGLGGSARYTGMPGALTWIPFATPDTAADLRAVAATSDGFVAVGMRGVMFALAPGATTWTTLDSGTTADLVAVHVIGGELFAAGSGGTIVRCIAGACEPMRTGTTADLHDLGGTRADDLFAVGGGAVLRFDGAAWRSLVIAGFEPSTVAVSPTTVWLGQRDGTQRGLYQLLRISPL